MAYRLYARLPGPVRRLLQAGFHAISDVAATRAWVRDFAIPVLVTAFARLIAGLLQRHHGAALQGNAFTEASFDVLVLLATMVIVRSSLTWNVPEMMEAVRDIAAATQHSGRTFLRDFATKQILSTRDIVNGLTGPGLTVGSPSALRPWFVRFFSEGGDTYIGVDSHPPSEYMTQYEWYLDVHASSLHERGEPRDDKRIISTGEASISREQRGRQQRPQFQRFLRWHSDNHVTVCWVNSDVANGFRRRYNIPHEADVGLWHKFAVAFEPGDDERTTISVWFPHERRRRGTTYEEIDEFVTNVVDKAILLERVAPGLSLVDRELAEAWIHYVNPDAREDGKVGGFLLTALDGCRSVFDAAAGIACDSVHLVNNGFHVVTNEVDELLLAQARRYANEHDVELDFKTLFWEDLPARLAGNQRFDALLCLGNSICLVEDESGRLECIEAFRDCLYDKGMLVIDERNFQYMLDHAKSINVDPIDNFRATLKGDVMYQGKRIRGYPSKIDKSKRTVHWRFFYNDPEVHSRGELDDRQLSTKDLTLHMFEHGELFRLLRRAGFTSIDVYADLELVGAGLTTMPDFDQIGDADFITYVAHKHGSAGPAREPSAREVTETPAVPGA